MCAAAVLAYGQLGGGWLAFVLLFLLPDLSILAYLSRDQVIASSIYNAAHTYLAPALLGGAGVLLDGPGLVHFALVWVAHIGADRFVGFGLKRPTGFSDTHLGGSEA